MPALTVYTNPTQNGICQVPVFAVGNTDTWTLVFNNGNGLYNPGSVAMNLGYVNGLENINYPSAFQWVDRLNNRHTGTFSITAGVPGSLTWDENPIGVQGGNGAWLLRGRKPPSTQIRRIYVDSGGLGYQSTPSVTIDPGSGPGTGATATAVMTGQDGGVQSVLITNQGSLYTSAPAVGFSGGSGSGAAGTAIIANGAVVLVVITNPGSGYTSAPSVSFTGGGGSNAAGTPALFSNMVNAFAVTNFGLGYTAPPVLAVTGGNGSGAQLSCSIESGSIIAIFVGNPGTGYGLGATYNLTFTGGGGSGAAGTVTAASSGSYGAGSLVSTTLLAGGAGYTSMPTITITPVGGTGLAGTVVAVAGVVVSVTITNQGSGYTNPPIVTFVTGGTGAIGYAQVSGGTVNNIVVLNGGSGYSTGNAITVSNALGSNGTVIGELPFGAAGQVTGYVIVAAGGYSSMPTMSLVGGDGSNASAAVCCAIASGTGVFSVTRIVTQNPGSGYNYPPSVVFSGTVAGSNVAASATSALTIDGIGYCVVCAGGAGYPLNATLPLVFTGSTYSPAVGYALTDGTGRVVSTFLTYVGVYTTAMPAISITSGSGSGAVIVGVCAGTPPLGGISNVVLTTPGSGYTAQPTVTVTGSPGSGAAISVSATSTAVSQVVVNAAGDEYATLPAVEFTPNLSTAAECSGIPYNYEPYILNPITFEVEQSVTATPWWQGREDVNANEQYDDSLLLIRPRILLSPTFTLQPDNLTWAATFDPSTLAFIQAVLRFRRSVTVDMQIFGGGQLLYIGSLTIMNALQVVP